MQPQVQRNTVQARGDRGAYSGRCCSVARSPSAAKSVDMTWTHGVMQQPSA